MKKTTRVRGREEGGGEERNVERREGTIERERSNETGIVCV